MKPTYTVEKAEPVIVLRMSLTQAEQVERDLGKSPYTEDGFEVCRALEEAIKEASR